MLINLTKQYMCIKSKILYVIVYTHRDILYIRKLGKTGYMNHHITEITLSNFKKCFEIY